MWTHSQLNTGVCTREVAEKTAASVMILDGVSPCTSSVFTCTSSTFNCWDPTSTMSPTTEGTYTKTGLKLQGVEVVHNVRHTHLSFDEIQVRRKLAPNGIPLHALFHRHSGTRANQGLMGRIVNKQCRHVTILRQEGNAPCERVSRLRF